MKGQGFFILMSLFGKLAASASEQTSGDCPWIQNFITPVPNFPKQGIIFQWYANILKDPEAFHLAIQTLADRYRNSHLDGIIGLDSRGFIFGAALAYELRVPLVLVFECKNKLVARCRRCP